jgi:hypothetical protein
MIMEIFSAEKDIEQEIIASSVITFDAASSLHDESDKDIDEVVAAIQSLQKDENKLSKLKEMVDSIQANMERPHPKMAYGSAILCSSVMNRNDDIFLAEEMWEARNTPVHTPYNKDHNKTNIIGHIIAARCLDKEANVIANDTETVPEYLDIEADFVLYESIYPTEAVEIKKRHEDGNAFVSMECKIGGFDYGLVDEEGNLAIIQRSEDTAFLTKHLRAFGGTGQYNEKKLGRIARKIVFTGMGDVGRPANPTSVYTKLYTFIEASLTNENTGSNEMAKENDESKVAELETALKAAEEKVSQVTALTEQVENYKKSEAALSASVDSLNKTVQEKDSKISELESKLSIAENHAKTFEDSKTKLEAANEELKAAKAELDEIKAKKKLDDRVSQLKAAGFDPTKTEGEVDKISKMSDETFAAVLEYSSKLDASSKNEDAKNDAANLDNATIEDKKPEPDLTSMKASQEVEDEIVAAKKSAGRVAEALMKMKNVNSPSKKKAAKTEDK